MFTYHLFLLCWFICVIHLWLFIHLFDVVFNYRMPAAVVAVCCVAAVYLGEPIAGRGKDSQPTPPKVDKWLIKTWEYRPISGCCPTTIFHIGLKNHYFSSKGLSTSEKQAPFWIRGWLAGQWWNKMPGKNGQYIESVKMYILYISLYLLFKNGGNVPSYTSYHTSKVQTSRITLFRYV